ncbi:MAG: 2-C-methyl-D-erythritol 4-phosphate cytidylyltransferase [Bacteroidales bacterium]|nr:2-C-methyl-D-erythritol 4-phosphate cytidylyltransferase [Bacteroidales bacterium]
MKSEKEYVILVAGGKGLRMKTDVPKQFMLLAGKPVLMRSVEAFFRYSPAIEIIVVLPQEHILYWQELCKEYDFSINHSVVSGGAERFFSVQHGLASVETPAFVAIHDGVRPLVSAACIARGFACARAQGSAVPVVDCVDSLRVVQGNSSTIIDRSTIKRVQTPQIFDAELLKQAYSQSFSPLFTDDASVWESAGRAVALFEGEERNIKLTTPTDFAIGEGLLA